MKKIQSTQRKYRILSYKRKEITKKSKNEEKVNRKIEKWKDKTNENDDRENENDKANLRSVEDNWELRTDEAYSTDSRRRMDRWLGKKYGRSCSTDKELKYPILDENSQKNEIETDTENRIASDREMFSLNYRVDFWTQIKILKLQSSRKIKKKKKRIIGVRRNWNVNREYHEIQQFMD